MIDKIHPDDTMYHGNLEAYFKTSTSALNAIERALAGALNPDAKINSILDFGCGYGRVLRAIKNRWPEADLTVCDLIKPAVDFCAETFNATPIYGDENLTETGHEDRFDLIWVGSVFTHLPQAAWPHMLAYLARHLRLDGTLVFTTHGRTSQWVFENHSLTKSHITQEDFTKSKEDMAATGFAFLPYSTGMINHISNKTGAQVTEGLYGVSFSTPEWVMGQVAQVPELTVQGYSEGGWGKNHDIVCVTKPRDLRIV
ncbi:MAG: trans-aconitate 2-methyltransferase [Roseovarius sp.]